MTGDLFYLKHTIPTWLGCNAMEGRKRTLSERPSTSVEAAGPGSSGVQKQAKLVLKPPKFITEPRSKKPHLQSFTSLLEGVLELETSDEVLEQLLQINGRSDSVLSRAGEADMTSSLKVIGKLWKKQESSILVCSVLVRTLVLVARRVKECATETGLHGNVQSLSLSMAEHGEFYEDDLSSRRCCSAHLSLHALCSIFVANFVCTLCRVR